MVYINSDTRKTKDCGKEIQLITNKIQTAFDNFFHKMLTAENYWQGEDADNFMKGISSEASKFKEFCNGLSELSKKMINDAEEIEALIISTSKVK